MIGAFERYYGQSFADKDWRKETSVWAAAWQSAVLSEKAEAARLRGEQVNQQLLWLLSRYVQQDLQQGMTDNNLYREAAHAIAAAEGKL